MMKYKKVMLAMMTMSMVMGNSMGNVLAEEMEVQSITESQRETEIQTEKENQTEKESNLPQSEEEAKSSPESETTSNLQIPESQPPETQPSTEVEPATESQSSPESQATTESAAETISKTVIQPQAVSEEETEKVSEKTEALKEEKEAVHQVKEISSVQVTGVDKTEEGAWYGMQETATCTTEGIRNHQAKLSHAYISTTDHYMVCKRVFVTAALTADENYRFADSVTGTVNGLDAEVVRKSDTEIEVTAYIDLFTHWHSTGNGVGMSESPIPTNYNETEHWYQCQYTACQDVESTIRDVEPHKFTGEIVGTATLKTPATCTEPAVYYKNCVCGYIGTEETFSFGDSLGHDIPKDAKYESDDAQHWKSCVREGCDWEERENHTGGTATCKEAAVCEICHESYGDPDPQNHVGEKEIRDAKPATEEEEGYTGDIYCTACQEVLTEGKEIPKLMIEEKEEESESESETETEPESEMEEKESVEKKAGKTETKSSSHASGTAVQTGDTTTLTGYVLLAISSMMTFVLGLRKKH